MSNFKSHRSSCKPPERNICPFTMFSIHYLLVLITLVFSCKLIKVSGLKITPRNQSKASRNQSLENHFTAWIHKNSAISLNNRPTKRHSFERLNVDDNVESNYETSYDKQDMDDFDVNNAGEKLQTSYRQVILDPNEANTLRAPHPYPFQPIHVRRDWHPQIEPLEIFPNPIQVHHYRKVPVAVQVPRYEIVPKPFYVPLRASPDYSVLHVDVYHPGWFWDFKGTIF